MTRRKFFVMPPKSTDFMEFSNIIQTTINTAITPLSTKIGQLDDKVNALALDRVTRTDIEKLRTELIGSMVPRDAYEPRHAALVERDTQLESSIRDMRRNYEEDIKNMQLRHEAEMQRLHERLESGKKQFEDRIDTIKEAELSTKDRIWVRISIIGGSISVAVAIIDFFIGHVHLN